MKPPMNFAENLKSALFTRYSKGLGDMLIFTGALGWILSSAGQIVGIASNKKIPQDEKKFLIPQEMADAAINIGSFIIVTSSIKKFTKTLASSGKVITKSIGEFCKEHNIEIAKGTDIGKALSKKVENLRVAIDINHNNNITMGQKENEINDSINKIVNFKDTVYAPFEEGMSVIGTVIGGILSSNIITPLLRNPIAAYKQKQSIQQEKIKDYMRKMNAPAAPAQNKLSIDSYKQKVTGTNNGTMKI